MRTSVLFLYLFGNREAILEIARNRKALWIGLLFVISAGLAREYDHESLLHEPWHVLIPLAASLATSLVLFLVLYAMPKRAGTQRPPIFHAYRAFLSLYWMTAPLAWLYAIPYERFLDAGDSTAANLWTLAAVAAWRVILMTRVIAVVLNVRVVLAFMIVMAFADALALAALSVADLPLINFMGGISLSESEQMISGVAFTVVSLGVLTSGVWILGSLVAFAMARPNWSSILANEVSIASRRGGLMRLSIAMVVFGLVLLPFTQPEQQRRYNVERHLKQGELAEGLSLMSSIDRHDFPPHWDPPPRLGYGEREPDIVAMVKLIAERPSADWVRNAYVEKLNQWLRSQLDVYGMRRDWVDIATQVQQREDTDRIDRNREGLQLLLDMSPDMPVEDRRAVEAILHKAPIAPTPASSAPDDATHR